MRNKSIELLNTLKRKAHDDITYIVILYACKREVKIIQ